MENYKGISVMSSGDEYIIDGNTLGPASTAVTSSVLGELTAGVSQNVKHESGASRVFVVTDKSQIDALQVSAAHTHTHTYTYVSCQLATSLVDIKVVIQWQR